MFPRLSDMINYLLGTDIILPVQTYGLFLALSFLAGAILFSRELKRKEKIGLLSPLKRKIVTGKPASVSDLVINALTGFVLGYKGWGMIVDYNEFVEDPQAYILSGEGYWGAGLLLAAGLLFYTWWSANKRKLPKPKAEEITVHPYQLTVNFTIIAAISGVAGAKLFDIFENFDSFLVDPLGAIFSFQGLTFYGGLIVAAIVVVWYARRNNISWIVLADSIAPALMLAYAIGRLGCHLSGDGCWGVVNLNPKPEWLTFLPEWVWAYNFPHNVINEGIRISDCAGRFCYVLEHPVFPTSFYESMAAIISLVVLWSLRKKITVNGMLFAMYLVLNGVSRFFIEQIRVNPKMNLFGIEITQAELISILLIITGIIGIIYLLINRKKTLKTGT